MIIVFFICLYISAAKTIILASFGSLIISIFRKKIKAMMLTIIVIIVPFIIIMLTSVFLNTYIQKLSILGPVFDPGTLLPRIEVTVRFLKDFSFLSSLIGGGLGSAEMSDNMYINIIQSFGLVGFFLFLILIVNIYKKLEVLAENNNLSIRNTSLFLYIMLTTQLISMHVAELLVSRLMIAYFAYILAQTKILYKFSVKQNSFEKFENISR